MTLSVQDLQESEELHRITLRNISDAVFITDDDGVFTYICPNVDVIFGYGPEEVRAMGRISALLGRELVDRSSFVAQGELRNIEHDIVTMSGERRVVLVHIKQVAIRTGTILYVCRDITERKASEEALRQNDERLTLALGAADLGTWDWDLASGVVHWSPETRRMLGEGGGAEPSFDAFLQLVHPDDRARVSGAVQEAIDHGTSYEAEFRVTDRDGMERWVMGRGTALKDRAGRPLRVLGVSLDITRRKQSEERLHEQLRFEALIGDLSARFAGLADADAARGIEPGLGALGDFLSVDRLAVWDIAADRRAFVVIGSWSGDGVPLVLAPIPFESVPAISAALLRGESFEFGGLEELPPEGDRVYLEAEGVRSLLVVPISLGGSWLGALSLAMVRRERTWAPALVRRLHLVGEMFGAALARQRSAAAIAEVRTELFHASRLSVAGELTAAVAHEIRQPLTSIGANAAAALGLLQAKAGYDRELGEILRDIRDDNRRVSEVMTRLGALLRKRELELRLLDANTVVSDVARLVRADAGRRHVALAVGLALGLPPVKGDRIYLQQVLLNLVANAMDAMRELPPSERHLTMRTAGTADGCVEFVVADSGRGITPDIAPRIFDAFFTTKKDGTGLGLSIARSIVEAHGGRIVAGNAPGGGAVFRFTVPASV